MPPLAAIPLALGTTWATIGAVTSGIATGAGLGLSMYGSVKSGQQQQRAAEDQARGQREAYTAQAEASRRNQVVAEENAQAIEAAGAYAEKQARLKVLKLEGTQAVGYAKSGVLPEGSPLDVMAETAALEEQDILATRYNYAVQAARYRSQGDFYSFEEQRNNRLAGSVNTPDLMTGSYMKAGTSLLTGVAKEARTWGAKSGGYPPGKYGPFGYGTESE